MKKSIAFSLLVGLSLLSCQSNKNEQGDEPIALTSESTTGNFGAEISDAGAVTLTQLVSELESNEAFEGKVIGEIKDVCSKKGCWMSIDLPNGETMRVTFKDYGFFVPKDAHGYPVVIEGIASRKITDVATLRHYAEDAGKSKEEVDAITQPKKEYAFEAIGVIIKGNQNS